MTINNKLKTHQLPSYTLCHIFFDARIETHKSKTTRVQHKSVCRQPFFSIQLLHRRHALCKR